MVTLTDKEVIDTYIDGLISHAGRQVIVRQRPRDASDLREIASEWADEEDKERDRNGGRKMEGKKKSDQQQDQGPSGSRKHRPDNIIAVVDQRPRKNKSFKDYLKK
jgi:hypothetical protein